MRGLDEKAGSYLILYFFPYLDSHRRKKDRKNEPRQTNLWVTDGFRRIGVDWARGDDGMGGCFFPASFLRTSGLNEPTSKVVDNSTPPPSAHICVRFETKFLRLKTPVTIGSRFGEWRVCWAGGWTRDHLSYLVMLVRVSKLR